VFHALDHFIRLYPTFRFAPRGATYMPSAPQTKNRQIAGSDPKILQVLIIEHGLADKLIDSQAVEIVHVLREL